MNPVKIDGADPRPLGAPENWNEEDNGVVARLFVRHEKFGGGNLMRSAWEVDAIEAAQLLAGSRLTLGVGGNIHPVVQLSVSPLPADFEPVLISRILTAPEGFKYVFCEMLLPVVEGGPRRVHAKALVQKGGVPEAIRLATEQIEIFAIANGWLPPKED